MDQASLDELGGKPPSNLLVIHVLLSLGGKLPPNFAFCCTIQAFGKI